MPTEGASRGVPAHRRDLDLGVDGFEADEACVLFEELEMGAGSVSEFMPEAETNLASIRG